jgi:hypothetical protein
MAGQSRTLKLSILADIDNLKKNLNSGSNEVEGFGSKLGGFAKKAGTAFAVAGAAAAAYAGTLLVDGVKSAIEDEAAQAKLATTLENVTGATNAQIKAVEDYITQTALANGITDDKLRPSLDRLIRSTKDATKAQELQSLALDIAAGTGKDLQAVSEALGKAYDGNLGALKKLGVGIDDSIIKSKDFDAAAAALARTFEGQASQQAETFQGKMARLTVAFDEAKETVGSYVLDALTPLISGFVDKGIPAITDFAENLGKTLGPAFGEIFKTIKEDLLPILISWWKFLYEEVIPAIASVVGPILEGLKSAFDKIKKAITDNEAELQPFYDALGKVWDFIKKYLAPLLGGVFKNALEDVGTIVAGLVTGFSKLVGFISNTITKMKEFVNFIKDNPVTRFFFGGSNTSGANFQQSGFTQNPSSGFLYYEDDPAEDPEVRDKRIADLKKAFAAANPFVTPGPTGSPLIVTSKGLGTRDISGLSAQQQAAVLRSLELQAETERLRQARQGTSTPPPTINLNVTGSIDPERTAREIVNTLNDSFYRGTNGALNFAS